MFNLFIITIMTKREYIQAVMRKMNEQDGGDGLTEAFAGADATNAEVCIERSYMSAWRRAAAALPKSYFRQSSLRDAGRHYYSAAEGTGCVVLPDDFYMLSAFRMRGWQRAAYHAPEETEELSQVQSNEFIRGNYELPVCTLTLYAPIYPGMPPDGDGRMMRYYSLPKRAPHHIEFGFYIPLTEDMAGLGAGDVLREREELYEPLQWIHAGIVFDILGRTDQAKRCDERGAEVLIEN
jgi:hypothetical protein